MIKKIALFMALVLSVVCCKKENFVAEGAYMASTKVSVKAASVSYQDAEKEAYQLSWDADASVDLYYVSTEKWTSYTSGKTTEDATLVEFTAEQEWMHGVNSNTFYLLSPSMELAGNTEIEPSALDMELPSTQVVADGAEKYMVSVATARVENPGEEKLIEAELKPALAVLELELKSVHAMTLKSLTLTSVGAEEGKGISGAYKLDVTKASVTSVSSGNSITLDFGEAGLVMEENKSYAVKAVVLPVNLSGLEFSVSGMSAQSTLETITCPAMDLKQGVVNQLTLELTPGATKQTFTLEVPTVSIGEEANNKQLIYLGANKAKSVEIKSSAVASEYEGGTTKNEDLFWEASASDWIKLSKTSGTGAAVIDVMVLPNLNPLKNARAAGVTDLSANGTANTYMVNAPGTYKFKANVMGNGYDGIIANANFVDYSGANITSAAISGGSKAELVWSECIDQITEVKYAGGYIEFTTSDYVVPSNAVIALYNGAGQAVWSWGIWFTNELNADDVITNANTNETAVAQGLNKFSLMDRNLGAMCQLPADARAFPKKRVGDITIVQYTDETKTTMTGQSVSIPVYQHGVASNSYYQPTAFGGMKYQWGRKDPFMMPYSSGNWASFVRFDKDNNEIDRITVENGGCNKGYGITVAHGIANPGVFYKANSTVCWQEKHNYDLWGNKNGNKTDAATGARPYGVKTIYDPCPPGYMVPTIDAFTAFKVDYIVGKFDNGYFFKANDSDTKGVFFSAAGEISSSGAMASGGSEGYYYTGSYTGGSNNSHQLQVKNGTVNNNNNTGHGNGRNIRCMREVRK